MNDSDGINEDDTRIPVTLRTGARICLLLAAMLVVVAGYLYWSPLGKDTPNGFTVRCGSAESPPTATLDKAACGARADTRRAQVLATLAGAAVLAAGGVLAFGVRRRPRRESTPTKADEVPGEPGTVEFPDAAGTEDDHVELRSAGT